MKETTQLASTSFTHRIHCWKAQVGKSKQRWRNDTLGVIPLKFLEAVLLYWYIYLSIFIAKVLFDHFWICVSLHFSIIFDKLIIYLPV